MAEPAPRANSGIDWSAVGLWAVRYGIGIAVILGGIIAAALGASIEIGGMAVGGGIAILLLNAIFRLGASGDAERQAEEDARDFFDEHGYWPDERPPGGRR